MCCHPKKEAIQPIFVALDHHQTGLHFNNWLSPDDSLNMFNYLYFFNGSGIGAGDFNNDGLIDLFFASNQGDNKLFLNLGGLSFQDVTAEATVPQDGGWSTGVSIVDINNDGLPDIYICKVGNFKNLHARNQLLVCTGLKNNIPQYEDRAKEYGLDFSGFSTQAAFFDMDLDGDLDMYLLNSTVHQDGSLAPRDQFINTYDSLAGDRLYRNDGHFFTDITAASGINSSSIGYGLGISIADINLDGWPDIYIGNDFHENDYLYINQKNGSFKDEGALRMQHTSKYSMGVDIADVNNDGYPEIITLDMLSDDPVILKRSLGDDDFEVFRDKIRFGYSYQYSRNMLQFNRGNDMFSEIGLYAGIAATDWSWAPLWLDFDNDGLKDLFISNGIPTRLNDIDFVRDLNNFERIQTENGRQRFEILKKYPEIKVPNKFFRNSGSLQFEDIESQIANNPNTFSNGAVYADLDNDGDLDIVVNNINDYSIVYENKTNGTQASESLSITLTGSENNVNAIGSKIIICVGDSIRLYEKYPARGFMSSMEIPIHAGIKNIKIDSAFLIWPDNSFQKINADTTQSNLHFNYVPGLPSFDYAFFNRFQRKNHYEAKDITAETQIHYVHRENSFNEFLREPLLPHMISAEGPALAVADINGDGMDDFFVGNAKSSPGAIFIQQRDGRFTREQQPALDADRIYEDVDAAFADINGDGIPDLIVVSGGNEFRYPDKHLQPRIYLNNGKGKFTRSAFAFSQVGNTISCVAVGDYNNDGHPDIFLGGRSIPWHYGRTPQSYLFQNDGKGNFKEVTSSASQEMGTVGMVTDAAWCDLDNDGDLDLVLCSEWGNIISFINQHGNFSKQILTNKKGWWNCILPVDINGDGHPDFIAGNLGLNSRFQASELQPVHMYIHDFDNNGVDDPIITYYVNNKETLFASWEELQKQIPGMKKKFPGAADFANASLTELFFKEKLDNAQVLSADYFGSVLLLNDGKGKFNLKELPAQAQWSPIKDASVLYRSKDDLPDVLVASNFYHNTISSGRYDADVGTVLINKGDGVLLTENIDNLIIRGEVRKVLPIRIKDKQAYILAKNNDSLSIVQLKPK